MSQQRNKLISLFVGNISNCIIHEVLSNAIDEENLRSHYDKELLISLEIVKRYRDRINPKDKDLPLKDLAEIKEKIVKKVGSELKLRVIKGYKNIDFESIGRIIDKYIQQQLIL